MSKEIWKDFIFGDKEYRVSNFGDVSTADGVLLNQHENADGYLVVTLGKREGRKTMRVHSLVAKAFVENTNHPGEVVEVNHIDFDRKNNHYSNLEWLTHRENIQKSIDSQRMFYQNSDMSGENNPNYGNRKLSKIYSENPDYAKEKQGRPGLKNGRCVPIRMVGRDIDLNFDYMGLCAEFLIVNGFSKGKPESIAHNVYSAVSDQTPYLGFDFYRI